MTRAYETKDRYEIAWLLLHNPGLDQAEIPVEGRGSGKFTEWYFLFPDYARQEALAEAYKASNEKRFAEKVKEVTRFVRSLSNH